MSSPFDTKNKPSDLSKFMVKDIKGNLVELNKGDQILKINNKSYFQTFIDDVIDMSHYGDPEIDDGWGIEPTIPHMSKIEIRKIDKSQDGSGNQTDEEFDSPVGLTGLPTAVKYGKPIIIPGQVKWIDAQEDEKTSEGDNQFTNGHITFYNAHSEWESNEMIQATFYTRNLGGGF